MFQQNLNLRRENVMNLEVCQELHSKVIGGNENNYSFRTCLDRSQIKFLYCSKIFEHKIQKAFEHIIDGLCLAKICRA